MSEHTKYIDISRQDHRDNVSRMDRRIRYAAILLAAFFLLDILDRNGVIPPEVAIPAAVALFVLVFIVVVAESFTRAGKDRRMQER